MAPVHSIDSSMSRYLKSRVPAIAMAIALAVPGPCWLRGEESPKVESPPGSRTPPADNTATAEPRKLVEGPQSIVKKFFETLVLGKVSLAYETLTRGSTIEDNKAQISMLRTKTDEAIAEFGQIEGHELVEMEWAGKSLVRLTYLSLGEKLPLRWRFYFYQRKGVWRLVDIRVDDRLKDLFHESGDSEDSP